MSTLVARPRLRPGRLDSDSGIHDYGISWRSAVVLARVGVVPLVLAVLALLVSSSYLAGLNRRGFTGSRVAVPGFVRDLLGGVRPDASWVRQLGGGVAFRLDEDGFRYDIAPDATVELTGLNGRVGAAVRYANGTAAPTAFGSEAVVARDAAAEQLLVVGRRLGVRTWRWQLRLRSRRVSAAVGRSASSSPYPRVSAGRDPAGEGFQRRRPGRHPDGRGVADRDRWRPAVSGVAPR